jgi:phytol kinase
VAVWLESVQTVWVQAAILTGWLGIVGVLAEIVRRRTPLGSELTRKVVHIGTGNIILLAWWLHIPAWVGITASVFFSGVTLLSYYVPIVPSINEIGRQSLGTFFYAVSIGVLVAGFWEPNLYQYAALGILVMTWGDGFAALVGQRFGRHPYKLWGMQKSWEGSLTMFCVSGAVSYLILLGTQGPSWQGWAVALGVAIVATGLEAFSKLGIDNLTVPLGSAAIAYWLNQF